MEISTQPYQPILATLAYVLSEDGKSVLMIRRDQRPEDPHFGKCNGLGGKLEPREDVVEGMRREIREEAGIECVAFALKGTINWPGFGKDGEDWFGFIFLVHRFSGAIKESNPEGSLFWVEVESLAGLPLWEGDRHFLPLVFGSEARQFHGVMPYKDGRPVDWRFSWVSA